MATRLIRLVLAWLALTVCPGAFGQGAQERPLPVTTAEATDYEQTTRYADVVAFMRDLDERSERAFYTTVGKTVEGREIPMLVLGSKQIDSPEAARAAKRPVVLLLGNIHAGEVEGKEALLMLARDLVSAEKPGVLERVTVLVMPIYNVDGNERIDAKHRAHQDGPRGGVGVRENAQGLDLNRDYVKMDAPETRALVRVLGEWDPAVVVDCHTTNGSFHRYTLTYSSPRHPAIDAELRRFAAEEMLPAVSKSVEEGSGYKTFWYGDFNEDHTEWRSYPALPRYGETYVGMRNRIAILSEAYVYAPFKDRILCTRSFCEQVLAFTAANAGRIQKLVKDADDRATKAGDAGEGTIATRATVEAHDGEVVVLGYVEEMRDGRAVRTETERDYTVRHVDRWVESLAADRPYAYVLDPGAIAVVQHLQRHGIRVDEIREDIEVDVQAARVEHVVKSERPFQGHTLSTLESTLRDEASRISAGSRMVRTGQPLGTLAAYMLEPMAEDGLAAWGLVGEVAEGSDYPVRRVPEPVSILTIAAPELPEDAKRDLPITYESVYESRTPPNLSGSAAGGFNWREDGEHFLQRKDGKTWRVHAATGRMTLHAEDTTMAAALVKIPVIDQRTAERLATSGGRRFTEDRSAFFVEHENDLYYCTMDGSVAVRLTSTPEREDLATFSPDGRFVAFVRGHNLWVVDVQTQTERQLTTTGTGLIECGRAGWVYFEELFGRNWQAYWWSPDSARIAFLETDSTGVPEYIIVDDNPEPQNIERTRYPRVGEKNPEVRVGIVTVAGGSVRWADLSAYEQGQYIIPQVSWFKDGQSVLLGVQDRFQTWMDMTRLKITAGRPEVLWRETTGAWVESLGEPRVLKDGSFVLMSERTGWKHLYHFEKDFKNPRAVTSGGWELRSLVHLDEEKNWVYFTGTVDSHIAENLYRVRLRPVEGESGVPERLTRERGHHSISMSPTGVFFVDTWSSHDQTPRVVLRDADGNAVRTLDSNPVRDLARYRRGAYELVQIPIEREGREPYVLEGSIVYPPDFDPERSYPVWFQTYAGPHAPTVRDAWNPLLWEQVLASDGFILFRADPYSASGKGAVSAWTAYKRLGVPELEDIKSAIAWLSERPYVDTTRIGMHGHSYGGFMTAYAMTKSDIFAAGISGAPVTDWTLYDTIYTERYMLTPQANPEGYAETSVVLAASGLSGKLLITHGTMDDNVHMQNAIRLIDALQKAKKQFRTMIYPGFRHGLFGDHYRRLMYEFIIEMRDSAADGQTQERPETSRGAA